MKSAYKENQILVRTYTSFLFIILDTPERDIHRQSRKHDTTTVNEQILRREEIKKEISKEVTKKNNTEDYKEE